MIFLTSHPVVTSIKIPKNKWRSQVQKLYEFKQEKRHDDILTQIELLITRRNNSDLI